MRDGTERMFPQGALIRYREWYGVQKDEDGSYDVFGTKAGNPIGFEVSKDLKTVTEQPGWGRGGFITACG